MKSKGLILTNMKNLIIFTSVTLFLIGLINSAYASELSPEPRPEDLEEESTYAECVDGDGGITYDNYFYENYCEFSPNGIEYANIRTCKYEPISGKYDFSSLVDHERIFCPDGCVGGACVEGEKFIKFIETDILETNGSYEVNTETGEWSYEKKFLVYCSSGAEYPWRMSLCPYKTNATNLRFIDPENMLKQHTAIERIFLDTVVLAHTSNKMQEITMEYRCEGMLLLQKPYTQYTTYALEFNPLLFNSKGDKITFKVARDFKHCIDEWKGESPIQISFEDNSILYETKEPTDGGPLAFLTNIEENLNDIQERQDNASSKIRQTSGLKWKEIFSKKLYQLDEKLMRGASLFSELKDKTGGHLCQEINAEIDSMKSHYDSIITLADELMALEEDLNTIQNMHDNASRKLQEILNLKWKNLFIEKEIKQLNETFARGVSSFEEVKNNADNYSYQEIDAQIKTAKSQFDEVIILADEITTLYGTKVNSYKKIPFISTPILNILNWIMKIF